MLASAARGAELRERLTHVADAWLAERIAGESGVALVAVGGYGRRELAPGSDLDVVLLHAGRDDVKDLADRIWYPIWDAGVKLDHSVRTVDEAVAVSREDLKAALGLLDARHVAGDASLTGRLREAVLAGWRRDAQRRLPELREAVRERAERYGELAFLLEPDLKECYGGLRDVHAITAAAAAWVVDPPSPRVRDAAHLLLDVRVELHRRSQRPSERLVLQEQGPVAAALGHDDADGLMRAVYAAARAVAFAADATWRRVDVATRPSRRRLPGMRSAPRVARRPLADDVVEQDGEVMLARDARPGEDPVLVLRVAAAAAQAALPIAPHALDRLVAESPPIPQPWPQEAYQELVTMLGAGRGVVQVLESLDQSGLLERLLPEWERVRCKPQRNAVHRFTVDRHLVEAAVEASALTRDVTRPDLLLVAALLHDIGKGYPGDHTEAGVAVVPAIARRIGLDDADTGVVVALVRHHLLLPDTATRRDLDEPATIRSVADAVGDRMTLQLLHALTVADAAATGPAAWNDWKARLVADLVGRAAAMLAGEPPPAPQVLDERRLALAAAGAHEIDIDIDGDTVTVFAPDRPGLLWRWAAVLSLHRLAIRSATATAVGRTAVTMFDVSPRFGSPPDWALVRADVRRAYDNPDPIAAQVAERERAYARGAVTSSPPRVLWVDDASDVATVLEVRAHDRLGLLHRLTKALADAGLDVRSARMTTLGAEVIDAFYVVDGAGAPVTEAARRREIEQALLGACTDG